MRWKNSKRILALILSLVMAGSLPATAMASEKKTEHIEADTAPEIAKDTVVPMDSTDEEAPSRTVVSPSYTKKDLRLMSAIIFCEARGESYRGQLAVGMVVMNRVHSNQFPNTIKDVVYQKGQFSPVKNGSLAKALKLYDEGKFTGAEHLSCIKAAKSVPNGKSTLKLNGKETDMSSYLFFAVSLRGSRLKIGNHRFK